MPKANPSGGLLTADLNSGCILVHQPTCLQYPCNVLECGARLKNHEDLEQTPSELSWKRICLTTIRMAESPAEICIEIFAAIRQWLARRLESARDAGEGHHATMCGR